MAHGCSDRSDSSLRSRSSPRRAARSLSRSRTVISIALAAAVAASGLLPKVEECHIGLPWNEAKISSVVVNDPHGTTPPDSAFARHRMSGTTPQWFTPNSAPVRPSPVCTSSAISRTSCFEQISRTSGQ